MRRSGALFRWLKKREDKKHRALLSLLHHHGEMRGLDIIKRSDGTFGRATVYVFLERLINAGWVSYRKMPFVFAGTFEPHVEERLATPFFINYYSITQKGRERLTQLGEPLSTYR